MTTDERRAAAVTTLDPLAETTGITPDLLRAYRALIATSSADAAQLASATGIDRPAAVEHLDALFRRGFATPLPHAAEEPGPRYIAVPPSVTLAPSVAAQEEATRRARAELGALDELYRVVGMDGGAGDVVEVVRGADVVAQWFARVQAGAQSEVSAFVQHPVAVTSAEENAIEDELVSRGVRYRALLERAMLEQHPAGLDAFAASLAAGEEARVMDSLPVRMVIIDRSLAFLPVLAERERAFAAALIVRPSALLTGLIALFDALWSTAAPVILDAAAADPSVGAVDDLDARLLSLLLSGQTDEAVASHLGVSLRTVQRRVRDLMDRAGVRTRVQLGWHAARAGWHASPR